MKVGLIGAKISKDWETKFSAIEQILTKNGLTVDYSYFETDVNDDSRDLEKLFHKIKSLINKNSFIVAEITHYSNGIGYFIGEAIASKRPVLVLHDKESGIIPSNIIRSGVYSKRLEFKEYTFESLEQIIIEYKIKVKSQLGSRYLLHLPSHLDNFLDDFAFKKGVPKSHIIREAIEKFKDENDQ